MKVRIRRTDGDAIAALGYAAQEPVWHVDTWFERQEGPMLGSIVVRQVLPDGPWSMAWETSVRTGPNEERHHLWTPIDGPRMQVTLQRLGMVPVLSLRAQRIPLQRRQRRIALERVESIGDFLEVPGPDKQGVWARDVAALLRGLGAATMVHSYRDLVRPVLATSV